MNRTLDNLLRFLPAILFLSLQIVRISYVCPDVELGGDAVSKWFLSVSLSQNETTYFNIHDHHHLRWGSWVVAYFLNIFCPDNISIYFLSTIIPSTIGAVIFILITSFAVGPIAASLFAILWIVDPELYRATFQLLPTGQGILPLSIICLTLFYLINKKTIRLPDIATTSFLLFWLYGVKETNLFFLPGVIMIYYKYFGIRNALVLMLMFLGFYCIETIVLYFISEGELIFGRVQELLFGDANHIKGMSSERIVRQLKKYYDGGWSIRFYIAHKNHIVSFFLSAFLSIIYISNHRNKINPSDKFGDFHIACSYLFLSYFIFTSIFIINIDPIVLGQPLRSRYLAILLPISYITIISFLSRHVHSPSIPVLLAGALVFWMYISSPLQWTVSKWKNTKSGIYKVDQRYVKMAEIIENADCVYSKSWNKLEYIPRLVPTAHRGNRLEKIISLHSERAKEGYIKKISRECNIKLSL